MTVYAEDHASAYADVLEAGTALTFTRLTNTYVPETDVSVVVPTTIDVAAVQDMSRSAQRVYERLGMKETEGPMLFVVYETIPTALDEMLRPGDSCPWRFETYKVKGVLPLEPDGTPFASYVGIVL